MAARRGGRGFKLASVGARVRWLRLLGSGVDEIVTSVWRRGSSRGWRMEEVARLKELRRRDRQQQGDGDERPRVARSW